MKTKLALVIFISGLLISQAVSAQDTTAPKEGLILTWKNEYGKWFACGPTQCTWGAWDSEEKVLSLVTSDDHKYTQSINDRGRCSVYIVKSGMRSYDNSPSRVKNLAKCR
jgi:hypothetical protein